MKIIRLILIWYVAILPFVMILLDRSFLFPIISLILGLLISIYAYKTKDLGSNKTTVQDALELENNIIKKKIEIRLLMNELENQEK